MKFLDTNGLKKLLELIMGKFKKLETQVNELENRPTGSTDIVDGSWNIPG